VRWKWVHSSCVAIKQRQEVDIHAKATSMLLNLIASTSIRCMYCLSLPLKRFKDALEQIASR